MTTEIELIRSTPEEKGQQIDNVANFQQLRSALPPTAPPPVGVASAPPNEPTTTSAPGLAYKKTARDRQNVFAALMQAVKAHSLGQIGHALYEVGGEHRRSM